MATTTYRMFEVRPPLPRGSGSWAWRWKGEREWEVLPLEDLTTALARALQILPDNKED